MSDARWACEDRIVEILSALPALATARVLPDPPTDKEQDNEYVFLNGTTGGYQDGPSAPGRRIMEDLFTVQVEFMARRGTKAEARTRVSEMSKAIAIAIRDSEDLDHLETDDWCVTEALPGEFATTNFPFDPHGPVVAGSLGIDVEVRHYGGNQ